MIIHESCMDIKSINEDTISITSNSFINSEIFTEIDAWKTSNEHHKVQKYRSTSLSDTEYEKAKNLIDIMKSTEDFKEYSSAFSKFCYFCHIVSRGVVLKKYNLKKGKDNKNSLEVDYAYNTKKITLDEGTILYHMSKVDGIKELNPVYKGKSVRGFMYDKPRVYFTIRKNMPKFLADYKVNEKMHMYVCKQTIKQAYVDPLVWGSVYGAVYVETNTPIPVEQVETNMIKDLINKSKSMVKNESTIFSESSDFDGLYNFINKNGLILENDSSIFDNINFI